MGIDKEEFKIRVDKFLISENFDERLALKRELMAMIQIYYGQIYNVETVLKFMKTSDFTLSNFVRNPKGYKSITSTFLKGISTKLDL